MSIGTSIICSIICLSNSTSCITFLYTDIHFYQAMKTKHHLRVTTLISVMKLTLLRRLTLRVVHTILTIINSHHLLPRRQKTLPIMEINLHLSFMKYLLSLLTILKIMQVNVQQIMILMSITHLHPELLVIM